MSPVLRKSTKGHLSPISNYFQQRLHCELGRQNVSQLYKENWSDLSFKLCNCSAVLLLQPHVSLVFRPSSAMHGLCLAMLLTVTLSMGNRIREKRDVCDQLFADFDACIQE